MLVKVRFESLDGEDHDVEIEYDPQLYNDGSDDVGWTRGHALLSHDRRIASRARRPPRAHPHELGLQGPHRRPARAHLRRAAARQRRPAGPHPPDRARRAPRPDAGDRLRPRSASAALDGRRATRSTTASTPSPPTTRQGWVDYRNQLHPIPAAALPLAAAYETSLLVLKAHEDKDNPGAFVAVAERCRGAGASCASTPTTRARRPYHLVWARDLYQIATALLAAGDKAAADARARLPVRPAAARRRLVPAEHPGRRHAEVEGHPDGPGRPADRARLAARAHRRARLAPRPQGRRLHRRARARSPSRSAGRTRRATRRARSPPRSPGWCARRTSRAQRRRRAAPRTT